MLEGRMPPCRSGFIPRPFRTDLHCVPSYRKATGVAAWFVHCGKLAAAGVGFTATLAGVVSGQEHTAPTPATRPADEIVARVEERAIRFEDLRVVAAQNGHDLRKSADLALALREAIHQEVLALEARRRGYENDPEIRRYVRSQIVQRLLREMLDRPEATAARPSDAELRAYYDKNLAEFTRPTVARAQVLALLRRAGDEETFPRKLAELQGAFQKPQANFGELVQHYSDDPAARTQGGLTPWLTKGEPSRFHPPALIEAVFSAPDTKAILGPVSHGSWVYFVRLQERRESVPTPFEQAKDTIARLIVRRQRAEAYDAYVNSLARAARVETWPEKIPALVEAETQTGGPPLGPVRVP